MDQIKLQPDHKKHNKNNPPPKEPDPKDKKTIQSNKPADNKNNTKPPDPKINNNNQNTNNPEKQDASKLQNAKNNNNQKAKQQPLPPVTNNKQPAVDPKVNAINTNPAQKSKPEDLKKGNQVAPTNNNNNNYNQNSNKNQQQLQKQQSNPKLDSKTNDKNNILTKQAPATQKVTKKDISTLNNIEYSKKSIAANLRDLLSQYNQLNNNQFILSGTGRDPIKEQKIKEFLEVLQEEKKQRRRKIRRLRKEEQERMKSQDEHEAKFEKEVKKKEHKKEVEERLKKKLEEIKHNQKEREKQKARWEEFYKQFKSEKPVFLLKLEEQKQREKEEQMELEEKLSHIKSKYKPLETKDFEEHEAKYQEAKEELAKKKEFEKAMYMKEIQKENEKLDALWRGKGHKVLEAEEQERAEKERGPAMKLQKIREYQKMVKEKLLPKTSMKREESRESLDMGEEVKSETSNSNKRRRYRFINGVSLGEVIEVAPPKRTEAEARQLGNQYLNMLRSLPKKIQKSESSEESELATPKKVINKQPIQRYIRDKNPLYDSAKRKRLSFQLPPDATKEQVEAILSKLRSEDKKVLDQEKVLRYQNLPSIVDYHEKQKQINDKIVDNIELKINLLSKMTPGPQSSRT